MRNVSREACREQLKQRFGMDDFRPGQWEVIRNLLKGRDCLCLFPTGAGKSVCFQLPAVLTEGVTLVISPLLALMHDQVKHLRKNSIPAAMLGSDQTEEEQTEVYRQLSEKQISLLYISPERLQTRRFQAAIRQIKVSIVIIDEAHCVLKWGREFRPEYAQIGGFIRGLPARPVVAAFTATASLTSRIAIRRSLGMHSALTVTLPVLRDNLIFNVHPTTSPDADTITIVNRHPEEKGIIYCVTRSDTEWIAEKLVKSGVKCEAFHAGLEPGTKDRILKDFSSGRCNLIAATIAFGMGIDIPDIRYIVHRGLPADVDAYVQETGRSGRDGMLSECTLLLTPYHLMFRIKQLRKLDTDKKKKWFRRKADAVREEKSLHDLLKLLLGGRCIQQGLSAYYGQHCRPCGQCSACLTRKAWPYVPEIRRIDRKRLRYWWLRTICMQYPEEANPLKTGLLTDDQLYEMAQISAIPRNLTLPEELAASFQAVFRAVN